MPQCISYRAIDLVPERVFGGIITTFEDYLETIKKISQPHYWNNPELLGAIYAMVPNYHLSKFQPYLPEMLQLRLIAETVFDVEGTLTFLKLCQKDKCP